MSKKIIILKSKKSHEDYKSAIAFYPTSQDGKQGNIVCVTYDNTIKSRTLQESDVINAFITPVRDPFNNEIVDVWISKWKENSLLDYLGKKYL